MGRFINLVGMRFSRLLVIERDFSRKNNVFWTCECACGNITSVHSKHLRDNKIKSCGCLNIENQKTRRRNLEGMKFGKLTVIKQSGVDKRRKAMWECYCDCGRIAIVLGSSLCSGHTKSCGCGISESNRNRAFNLEGMRFGRLVALKSLGGDKYGQMMWECQCDCGNKTIVAGRVLNDNRTISCGCYNRERTIETHTTHGYHDTTEYGSWRAMKKKM